jgi:hypothetical protein
VLLKVSADLLQLLFELIWIEFFRNIMPLIKCSVGHDNLFFHVRSVRAGHISPAETISVSDLTARGPRIISILIDQLPPTFGIIHCVLQQVSIFLQPLLVLAKELRFV